METNYNEELKKLKDKQDKLIKKAEKEGYRLVNNELTKETFQSVIEFYGRAETDYESYGNFYVFKKVIPISKETLEKIINLNPTKENLIENFMYNEGISEQLEGLDTFYELTEWGHIDDTDKITRIIEKDELEEEYSLEDGQNLYLEFFFESDNANGYISVYDMPIEDLEKQEKVNLFFSKYLRFNM